MLTTDSSLGKLSPMCPVIPSRAESIELIGGHPALDLVNTVSWRHDPARRRESLAAPPDLVTWAHRAALLDERSQAAMRSALAEDPQAGRRLLRRVHQLREALYEHLAACIDHPGEGQQVRPDSALHRTFIDAVAASSLTGAPARWDLPPRDPVDLARVLGLKALDLTQTMSRERLRRCADDGCGWLFLDATRNHSRRWCSSADCGNRDRARRHYANTRQRGP